MAIQEMAFVPATGWNDPTTFPEKVNNASDVRDMLQLLHDETKDYLNDVVKPAIDNLQAGTIPTGKIADGAVTTPKLADGAVTNAKLGAKAVKQANIDDLAVDTGQIAAKAVTAAKIADATITATQIANTTITGAKMANGTVTSTQLSSTSGSEAVATGNIRASAVTDAKIASGVTGSKISGALTNATIDASKITSGTLSMDRIGSKAITAAKIADSTITATQIANTTITGGKLANSTITTTQLASNSVVTAVIKDGNVTDAKIASGITASKISGALSNATLDGAKITSGTVAIARLPYETTLSPTLDTKLPTSKAVATYVASYVPQNFEQSYVLAPITAADKVTALSSVPSVTFAQPIPFSSFSAVQIEFHSFGFSIASGSGSVALRVLAQTAGGSAVNIDVCNILVNTSSNPSTAGTFGENIKVVIKADGSGLCSEIDTYGTVGGYVSKFTSSSIAKIIGVKLNYSGTLYSAGAIISAKGLK